MATSSSNNKAKHQKIAFVDNPVFEQDVYGHHDDQNFVPLPHSSPGWAPSKTVMPVSLQTDAVINVRPAESDDEQLRQMLYPKKEGLFKRMKWEFWAVNGMILGHIILTGYTDPLDNGSDVLQILMVSLQIGMLVAIMMAFFVLTSQTLFVKLGRYDRYMREFRWLYGTFALEFVLMTATKVFYIVLILDGTSHLAMWQYPGYMPLWAVQRVALVAFWLATCYSSMHAFDERYFSPGYLLDS